jgi:hypothetical protein
MNKLSLSKIAGLALAIVVFSIGVSAQTRKPKPKPLATPPVLTGAEIISQAGDTDPQTQPVDQPADRAPQRPTGTNAQKIKDLNDRVGRLEADKKSGYDEKQRLLLLNLDILTRAEQRTESLRKQVFEMAEKENTIHTRLDQIEYDIRPEVIERNTNQIAGSLRPEEIRESRRKSLDGERRSLQSLLTQIQNTRAGLDAALARAEQMVDKLREKLEKDIDNALLKEDTPEQQ